LNLYAREGFIEAEVRPSVDELPAKGGDEQVRVVFNVIRAQKRSSATLSSMESPAARILRKQNERQLEEQFRYRRAIRCART
jgi:hypothetical protein